jgi:hypothetical protein
MLVFDDLGILGKLAIPSFLKFWTCEKSSLGLRDTAPRTEATGGPFSIEIPANLGKILAIRELHVVAARVLFLEVLDLQINSWQVGKNLCTKVTSSGENVPDFQHNFLTFVSFPVHG